MNRIRSADAEIAYEVQGSGPPVVLLHPFPVSHEFWQPAAKHLNQRYRLIIPDLRGHGQSDAGNGPATMEKHASDLNRILNEEQVGRAPFVGVSIGGYVLFEFWRRFPGRIAALILCNTKAQADGPEARSGRLKAANDVLERGTEPFFAGMISKVFAETTRQTRPDLAEGALQMMREMSAEDVAAVQRGMADRPDSLEILKTINVPTLLITGDEDQFTGVREAELMKRHITRSEMKVICKAGHYSPWERPEDVGAIMRQFLDCI